ncbi:MAG TPA: Fur family transcriptional regulator [Solirubrobacteraceae bacterium]|jgi:Fur family ferric uptake transcriptional regulator
MATASDTGSWTEQALHRLAEAGHRSGGARRELLTLMGAQHCALSALEIEEALAGGPRRVSRASIYRILEELEAIGLAQRVDVGSGITRFEAVRSDSDHHHHLVCDSCGQLQPFTDEGLERAIAKASEHVPLEVSEHEVVLHGTCASCLT